MNRLNREQLLGDSNWTELILPTASIRYEANQSSPAGLDTFPIHCSDVYCRTKAATIAKQHHEATPCPHNPVLVL